MQQTRQDAFPRVLGTADRAVSRRVAVTSSALAVAGVLAGSAFGRQEEKDADRAGSAPGLPRQMQERIEQSRAFSERMRNAGSMEERMKIMAERQAQERARAIEDLKEQLGVSDREWVVIKPRVEAVYDLVRPPPQFGRGEARTPTPVEQRRNELRALLGRKEATPDEIRAGLAALRAAREKATQELARARQSLRQLMTVRQEAVLVVNGLLD